MRLRSCSTQYDENRDDVFCCVKGYQLLKQSKEIYIHSCVVSKSRSVFVYFLLSNRGTVAEYLSINISLTTVTDSESTVKIQDESDSNILCFFLFLVTLLTFSSLQ